jgi:alpha-methylacyl-CoA racemase
MNDEQPRHGPLAGVRVVELAGIGPCPFAAMVLADLGAEVIRLDRVGDVGRAPAPGTDALNRSRPSLAIDLKHPGGAELVLDLVERADALIEGFRPGVAERLGVGPEPCLARNPAVAYGRMTGWGQDGPYASMPGHDINYIALTGALAAIGRPDQPPAVPLNLIGDFGGGGMLLAVGVLAAILSARRSGAGQVVDAAMTDGAALLMTLTYGLYSAGAWTLDRSANLLDGGTPFYQTYQASDGYVAVGGLEPQFHAAMLQRMGLDDIDPAGQYDRSTWDGLRGRLAGEFRKRTRREWEELFQGSEVCIAPVLDMSEAPCHLHNLARGTFQPTAGGHTPTPAPRFSATPTPPAYAPPLPGADTLRVLQAWGLGDRAHTLLADGVIRQA